MNHISPDTLPTQPADTTAPVVAPLNFIVPQSSKPSFLSAAYTGGEAVYRFQTREHAVPIADLRPLVDSLSLDREGFELLRRPSQVRDFYDDDQIEGIYYSEIEALLKERLGASRVVIFDATRRSDSGSGAANKDGHRGPARTIHVDYTEKSGPQRLFDLIGPEEAEALRSTGKRIVQVNVWRPISGPVQRSPLALADARSVKQETLVATDQVFPDRTGEIYHLTHDTDQRWYYAPLMAVDEALLIKGWDSLNDGRARFTPHTAFPLPNTPDSAPARESIEVRTYAIID